MKNRAQKAMASRNMKKENVLDKYAYHIVIGIFILIICGTIVNFF